MIQFYIDKYIIFLALGNKLFLWRIGKFNHTTKEDKDYKYAYKIIFYDSNLWQRTEYVFADNTILALEKGLKSVIKKHGNADRRVLLLEERFQI